MVLLPESLVAICNKEIVSIDIQPREIVNLLEKKTANFNCYEPVTFYCNINETKLPTSLSSAEVNVITNTALVLGIMYGS